MPRATSNRRPRLHLKVLDAPQRALWSELGQAPAMTTLPVNEELLAVARRVVWFKPAAETLADVPFFVAHLLTYSTPEDVGIVTRYLSADHLREALDAAPAGVFEARSWNYWNLMLGRHPAPSRPVRVIPDAGAGAAAEPKSRRRKTALT